MSLRSLAAWMPSRFLLVISLLVIANAAAWYAFEGRHRASRLELLSVERFEPAGQRVEAGSRPTLVWHFNLDVNTPGVSPVVIKPKLAGEFSWQNSRTLCFKPAEPLPVANRWSVVIPKDRVRSVQGFSLKEDFAQSLHTAPLELKAIRQTGYEAETVRLALEFNDLIQPAEAAKMIEVAQPRRKYLGVPSKVLNTQPSRTIELAVGPIRPLAKSEELSVRVRAGLSANAGPMGLAQDIRQTVTVATELLLLEARGRSETNGTCSLTLHFSGAYDLEKIKRVMTIEPAVAGLRFEANDEYLIARGKFQPATRYAIRIAEKPGDDDADSYPRAETRTVFVPDMESGVGFESTGGYLGSNGSRSLRAFATNVSDVELNICRLYDSNLVAWPKERGYYAGRSLREQGTLVATKKIHLSGRKNVRQPLPIRLDEVLPVEHRADGVFAVQLKCTDAEEEYGRSSEVIVTLSDIGLSAKVGRQTITAAALSLSNAQPMEAIRVRVFSSKHQLIGEGATGSDGLVTIKLKPTPADERPETIIADREIVENGNTHRSLTWLELDRSRLNLGEFPTTGAEYLRKGYEAFVYTDRGVFRPGETVTFRAIVRGVGGATPPAFPVQWVLIDKKGRRHDGPTHVLDADGAVRWDYKLAESALTGAWNVELRLPMAPGESVRRASGDERALGQRAFQVEDFLPDRLQVAVKVGDGARGSTAGTVPVEVEGKYLFGQAGSGLAADLKITAEPATFAPAGWSGWTFRDSTADMGAMRRQLPLQQVKLDDNGKTQFDVRVKQLFVGEATSRGSGQKDARAHIGPWKLRAEASVHDVSGRAVTRSAELVLDSTDTYLGIRQRGINGTPGLPVMFEAALVRPDGTLRQDDRQLQVELLHETWNNTLVTREGRTRFESSRVLEPVKESQQTVEIVDGRASFRVTPPHSGTFVVRAKDEQGTQIVSQRLHAYSREWEDSINRENPEKLELVVVPNHLEMASRVLDRVESLNLQAYVKDAVRLDEGFARIRERIASKGGEAYRYKSGEWASVIVKSPFAGTLVLTVETDEVVDRHVVQMNRSHVSVPVRISAACRPNAYISASVVRKVDPTLPWRAHRAFGIATVSTDESDRRLIVEAIAPGQVRPEHTLSVPVRVTNSQGLPVANAAVTVAALDEGICQLTGFHTPDPFGFFTRKRGLGVGASDLYSDLIEDSHRVQKTGDVGGDDEIAPSRYQPPVSARRVKPVSFSTTVLHTDADGMTQAEFPIPQFSGKLRVMAIAYAGPASGGVETSTLVRSPLIVQAGWPRFAAPGDRFEVPFSVFNTETIDVEAEVRVSLEGPIAFADGAPQVPPFIIRAGKEQQRKITLVVKEGTGVAKASIVVLSAGQTSTDSVEFPVRPASPAMTFVGADVAKPGSPLAINVVPNLLAGTGEFRVRVMSRPELILPEGLDYLNRYPYGCSEQIVSCLFPLISLGELGRSIDAKMFDPTSIREKVEHGINQLSLRQRADGGLSMWAGGEETWVYGSIYAAHFVTLAESLGHTVPPNFRNRLYRYLEAIAAGGKDEPEELENQAYACYVLALARRNVPEGVMARLSDMLARPPITPQFTPTAPTRFLLSAAYMAMQQRTKADRIIPPVFPEIRADRQLSGNLGSAVRDRALILSTLLAMDRKEPHPAAAGLAEQLVDMGRKGQWRSTHDMAMALMALGQYQRIIKDVEPYSLAELFRGDTRLSHAVDGQELQWLTTDVITDGAATQPSSKLFVKIAGPDTSRGFVSWMQSGVPVTPPADQDMGMTVRRRMLDAEGKQELDPKKLVTGQLVRVEWIVSSAHGLDNVVLEDMLPAGLEVENPRLATTARQDKNDDEEAVDGQVREIQASGTEIRDDRLVVFTNLPGGACRYSYLARAITVGEFVLPPMRGECMYDRSTFSIHGAGTMKVSAPPEAGGVQ